MTPAQLRKNLERCPDFLKADHLSPTFTGAFKNLLRRGPSSFFELIAKPDIGPAYAAEAIGHPRVADLCAKDRYSHFKNIVAILEKPHPTDIIAPLSRWMNVTDRMNIVDRLTASVIFPAVANTLSAEGAEVIVGVLSDAFREENDALISRCLSALRFASVGAPIHDDPDIVRPFDKEAASRLRILADELDDDQARTLVGPIAEHDGNVAWDLAIERRWLSPAPSERDILHRICCGKRLPDAHRFRSFIDTNNISLTEYLHLSLIHI